MMIKRAKFWCFVDFFGVYIYKLYVRSDNVGIESAAGKTGHEIKWQIKWLGLSLMLLCKLRYAVGITFQYPKNYDIRQPFVIVQPFNLMVNCM
jgi:hypothetical protein